MTEEDRRIFSVMEERKQRRDPEDTCDSCHGTGRVAANSACADCLGQGVLLFQEEYDLILHLSGWNDDSILDAEVLQ